MSALQGFLLAWFLLFQGSLLLIVWQLFHIQDWLGKMTIAINGLSLTLIAIEDRREAKRKAKVHD